MWKLLPWLPLRSPMKRLFYLIPQLDEHGSRYSSSCEWVTRYRYCAYQKHEYHRKNRLTGGKQSLGGAHYGLKVIRFFSRWTLRGISNCNALVQYSCPQTNSLSLLKLSRLILWYVFMNLIRWLSYFSWLVSQIGNFWNSKWKHLFCF